MFSHIQLNCFASRCRLFDRGKQHWLYEISTFLVNYRPFNREPAERKPKDWLNGNQPHAFKTNYNLKENGATINNRLTGVSINVSNLIYRKKIFFSGEPKSVKK